ncbi:MAG: DUF4149 domain-containing protein [Pyrinomonadaceae bacterium]
MSLTETLTLLTHLKLFLIAMWFGAALFFSAVVAPSAFSVMRAFQLDNTGEIAGTLVTRTLSVVNVSGFVIGVLLWATALAFAQRVGRRSFVLELISALVLATTTAVGHWVIAARMRALRAAMVIPIDQVPIDDPRRMVFNRLHGYSVTALGIAMIAALVAFAVVAYRMRVRTN